jgi:hypothetical protein
MSTNSLPAYDSEDSQGDLDGFEDARSTASSSSLSALGGARIGGGSSNSALADVLTSQLLKEAAGAVLMDGATPTPTPIATPGLPAVSSTSSLASASASAAAAATSAAARTGYAWNNGANTRQITTIRARPRPNNILLPCCSPDLMFLPFVSLLCVSLLAASASPSRNAGVR